MVAGIRDKCYGFDLLWKEYLDSWHRGLAIEIRETEQRLRYLKHLRDHNLIPAKPL